MLDAALIAKCSDPSLKSAVVGKFVAAVGTSDPLAITVRSGDRLILVPKATTPEEAVDIIRQYVGRAVVRVGITQLPAGIGMMDASELKSNLVDACENLRMGTKMFAKILRIVSEAYGRPTSAGVFPYIFDDAISAWKTGRFEGKAVFQAHDPGADAPGSASVTTSIDDGASGSQARHRATPSDAAQPASPEPPAGEEMENAQDAPMRIDLSRLKGAAE
ncbi:MAG: conjugal transfer protein TraH [Hyphomicrobiales bacterium]|nr:conjugal transfer protein TraH [Hyphomicrobiales bacterium]